MAGGSVCMGSGWWLCRTVNVFAYLCVCMCEREKEMKRGFFLTSHSRFLLSYFSFFCTFLRRWIEHSITDFLRFSVTFIHTCFSGAWETVMRMSFFLPHGWNKMNEFIKCEPKKKGRRRRRTATKKKPWLQMNIWKTKFQVSFFPITHRSVVRRCCNSLVKTGVKNTSEGVRNTPDCQCVVDSGCVLCTQPSTMSTPDAARDP